MKKLIYNERKRRLLSMLMKIKLSRQSGNEPFEDYVRSLRHLKVLDSYQEKPFNLDFEIRHFHFLRTTNVWHS